MKTHWRLDWLQVSAVVLVVAMSAFLMTAFSQSSSFASDIYNQKVPPFVQVELSDTQPNLIIQTENQWLGRFKITTDSSDPVILSNITFSPQGTLEPQIIQWLVRYPLTLTSNGVMVGIGQTWLYDDRVTQTVSFNRQVSVDVLHPILIDVSTDLNNQVEETFGITLVEVGSNLPIDLHGAPVAGRLLEIQERL